VFPGRRRNRWGNFQGNPRASAAILVPVFSAHFAVAAGIVAEEIVAAEADAQSVAAAATVVAVATADAEDLSAGPAGVAAADSIAAAVDVPATAIPVDTDTRGAHN
jgi:predicted pyridoxine 5'-phosphate oxidase superfamily flavin-nucleotide-binding protein